MSGLYVTSASLPFTRSWGRKTGFKKFIENSSFDQNNKFLRYFAQHETKIHLGEKNLGGYRHFKERKNIPVLIGTSHRKPEYLEIRRMFAQ